MAAKHCLALLVVAGLLAYSHAAARDEAIAKKEYRKDPIQRAVASTLGGHMPEMRDCLVNKKHKGQGAVQRHAECWSCRDNWKFRQDKHSPIGNIATKIESAADKVAARVENQASRVADAAARLKRTVQNRVSHNRRRASAREALSRRNSGWRRMY